MSIEEEQKLPAGWRWAKLGDVCRVASGSTPSSGTPEYWDGDIYWITPTDLGRQASHLITDSVRRISKAGFDNCGTEMVPVGSVVMSSRAPIGHLGIATVPLCTNQGCKSFIPCNSVDTHFLFYALKMSVPSLKALGSGATFAEVSKSQVQAFSIPLPPLPEQKRIASILTEKMAAIDKARVSAEARLKAAKELPAAYLREVFESEEAQEWPRKKVRDLLNSPLCTGISKPASPSSDIDCLTLSAVRNGKLDLSARKSVGVTHKEAARNWVKPGGFYVVRGNGNLSLVGRGALAPDPLEENVLYPDLLIETCPDPQVVTPEYLSVVWNTDEVRSQIEAVARTSAGIYKINLQNLGNISIPVPDVILQPQVAKTISTRAVSTAALIEKIVEETMAIKALPVALLRQAFSGEL